MYWHEDGHPNNDPDVSAESCPKDPAKLEAVKNFIKEVSWENEPIGKLMALSDRESKEKFHSHTQDLRQNGLLKHIDQGPHAVNSSLVAIGATPSGPQRCSRRLDFDKHLGELRGCLGRLSRPRDHD